MTLDSFISTYNNKFIDVDSSYGAQCWDLVELYAEIVLNVPKNPWAITLGPQKAAKEAWTVFDAHLQQHFDKIPAGNEQKGDINVYNGHGIYTEGHINIDLGNGQVFEQNADPDSSPAHISTRPTTYLLGSLRKKGGGIVEPGDYRVNDGDIINIYQGMLGRQPSPDEIKVYEGKTYKDMLYAFIDSAEFKARVNGNSLTPTILKKGDYRVQ